MRTAETHETCVQQGYGSGRKGAGQPGRDSEASSAGTHDKDTSGSIAYGHRSGQRGEARGCQQQHRVHQQRMSKTAAACQQLATKTAPASSRLSQRLVLLPFPLPSASQRFMTDDVRTSSATQKRNVSRHDVLHCQSADQG